MNKKLGFGFMRLPMTDGEVDVEKAKEMVDLFMEGGFDYFDTSWGYIDGKSESALKEALVDRYPREQFRIGTKLQAWLANSETEAKAMFDTSLMRTGAGYFDCYLLHNLGDSRTASYDRFGIWDFLAEKKEKGLIKRLGFSYHDNAEKLDELLKQHPEMDFVQLQINYADWDSQDIQARKCYEVARAHRKPIIVMEPVKGGLLAELPKEAVDILKKAAPKRSCSHWALGFAASLEGVELVLSGMANAEQMKENITFMKNFQPLSKQETDILMEVAKILRKRPGIPCTACGYCTKGCPQNIAIPKLFQAYNTELQYEVDKKGTYDFYTTYTHQGKASDCIRCGQCEVACPQHIKIIEMLDILKEKYE